MAHGNKIIKKIQINGTTYEIHDEHALHTLADLAALGINTEGAFIFKGTVATVADLPSTGNKVGYVYHVTENHSEYIWAKVDDGTTEGWEEFGEHLVIEHTHDINGSATVTGTNAASAVTGNVTVTGTNAASSVTGSGTVSVPVVTKEANYLKINTTKEQFVQSYPGASSKMVTTSVTPAGAAASVIATITPATGSVTGVSGSTKASKATAGTAVSVAKPGSAISVPKVENVEAKSASKVTAKTVVIAPTVDETNGILSFTLGDSCTVENVETSKVTMGTALSITPAVSNGTITPYTFTDVTVPKAASAATTVVTGVSSTSADVATVGTAVTVATGSLASTGTGSSVLTGLGTPTKKDALTSATLAEGTSADTYSGDTVAISSKEVTVSITGTAAAQKWTQKTGVIAAGATAAAQKWTQKTGTISGVTGLPEAPVVE